MWDKAARMPVRMTTQTFHAKTTTKIGMWNVRTLNQDGRLTQVLSEMEKYSINILGLSEVLWKGIRKIVRDGVTFKYSGNLQKHMYRVGICINSHTAEALLARSPISDHTITAWFQLCHVKVTVLQVYAPTNESSDKTKNNFYNLL